MGAAAAAILIKERHIVEAFERAGATSPERARIPEEITVGQHGVGWRRLRSRAVVRESPADSGLFYVDLEVWRALRRLRRRLILAVLLIAIALAVLMALR